MKEIWIDISHQASKSIDEFLNEAFDYVITLCDYAAVSCPNFPGQVKRVHWSLEDPAAAIGPLEKRVAFFRKIRDEIKTKIEEFLKPKS
jgi:arsenate reductase